MFKWYIYLDERSFEKTVFADYIVIDETGQKLFYSGFERKKILIAVAPVSALVVKAQ